MQTTLGHSSLVAALTTYVRLWPGVDDRTQVVIDGILGSVAPGAVRA
jgi:hypothetical protein